MKSLKYIFIVISIILLIKDLIGIYRNLSEISETKRRIENYKNNPPNIATVARDAECEEITAQSVLEEMFNNLVDGIRACKVNIVIEILETSIKAFLLVLCFKFL